MGRKKVGHITSFVLLNMKSKFRETSIITKDHKTNLRQRKLTYNPRFLTCTAKFFLLLAASIHEIQRIHNNDI